jgi:glycosyltransferase involved in cell wall biosynthesis
MRVLALTNLYPPHALGGYEWSCHDVLRRFAERGHEPAVLTTSTRFDGMPDDEIVPFPVVRDLEWYWDDHELLSPSVPARLAIERRNARRLRAALDRHRPDVVSVWNVGAMSHGLLRLVAAADIPIVYVVCDEWPVYGPHLDAWGRLFRARPRLARAAEVLLRVPCRQTDLGPTGAWCFTSQHTRDACRAGSPSTFGRSGVFQLGVEPADFPVVEPGPSADGVFGWRLLYVGRLDERKGVLTAVDALGLLPAEATLTLVGRGDAHGAILERAGRAGLDGRVTVSSVDRSEIASWYREADAFLFTSEWAEPFGLTPIEAMACGTPVIGTGTGGSGDFLVDGVNCLRYPPGDARALAAAVERLAADAELRDRLRRGGAALATALTTDRVADVLEEWHRRAAAGFPDGLPAERPLPLPGTAG